MKTVLIYGSSGGNTSDVAGKIKENLGGDINMVDAADASADDLNADFIILGTSTWGIGDLQDDFEDFKGALEEADLSGKTVALFGLGDQDGYPDTFCDGLGEIYETIAGKGAKIVGATSSEGYDFDESRALVDGKFIGLIIDEDNQSDLTDERVEKWIEQLKTEM